MQLMWQKRLMLAIKQIYTNIMENRSHITKVKKQQGLRK